MGPRRIHRTIGRLVVATCLVIAGEVRAEEVAQRWAVLIGIDDYANAQDLAYCGADQRDLRARLRNCGFPDDHVFLLHDDDADVKYRPSQRNIERQLGVVLNLAAEQDLVVIAFSGHGVSLDGKSYLCPNDATLDDPTTLVSLDGIYERLSACAAKFKLMLVDACRNDPRPGKTRSFAAAEGTKQLARSLAELKLPEGVVLLNSCAPGEISWEEEKFGHGVYMHFVLEALDGAADADGDQAVSLNELQSFAAAKTKTYVARRFSETQRPFFKLEGEGELMDYALLPVREPRRFTNSLGMAMLHIPAGEFQMGCPPDELGFLEAETLHRVRITRPFFMSATEVTRGQFAAFVEDASYQTEAERENKGGGYNAKSNLIVTDKKRYSWRDTGFLQTDSHPVVNVTWNDAQEFCRWLSAKEGLEYRLPTEAEWEYACRAGTTTAYYSGNDPETLATIANYADPTIEEKFGDDLGTTRARDGHLFTAAVGQYKPNAFGLFDMSGNVWEWCDDWYDETYYRDSRIDDPAGLISGEYRVIRGGSFLYTPESARSGHRNYDLPVFRDCDSGFRVVTTR
jgi:formylglycine-generating enzyme required for sulfatase activity